MLGEKLTIVEKTAVVTLIALLVFFAIPRFLVLNQGSKSASILEIESQLKAVINLFQAQAIVSHKNHSFEFEGKQYRVTDNFYPQVRDLCRLIDLQSESYINIQQRQFACKLGNVTRRGNEVLNSIWIAFSEDLQQEGCGLLVEQSNINDKLEFHKTTSGC